MTIATASLTALLGIDVPILQAGMGMGARHALVAAVSEAGGLGVLGGAPLTPDALREEIRAVRSRTDRPFGVDLLLPPQLTAGNREMLHGALSAYEPDRIAAIPELEALVEPGHCDDQVEVCIEEEVPVLVSGLGSPAPYLDRLHDVGMRVLAIAGTVRHARQHADAGVDAIIASGSDGGGHVGAIGSLSLWAGCLDALDVPVIAGGGIGDDRTLAAALVMGCAGAWVGTRFLATAEADCHEVAKTVLVEAGTDDTTVTKALSGKPMRVLRTPYVDTWRGREHEVKPFPLQAIESEGRGAWILQHGDIENGAMPAGSVAGLVHDVPPAAQVLATMWEGAQVRLAGRA